MAHLEDWVDLQARPATVLDGSAHAQGRITQTHYKSTPIYVVARELLPPEVLLSQ